MDLAAAAEIAIPALVAALQPQAIVWFGSAVRGETHKDSDLDFLIVVPREAGTHMDVFRRASKAIWDLPVPVDLLIYYPDEVAARLERPGSVVTQALQSGRVVHGQV